MSNTITPAGYIVFDNERIVHGFGGTANAAFARHLETARDAEIMLIGDNEEAPEGVAWARKSDFNIRSATADLLTQIEERGGDVAWLSVGGIACTREEAWNYYIEFCD
jgi:hypothetical protein